MNKKQVIVGWGMILSVAIMIAYTIGAMPINPLSSIITFYKSLAFIIIIGGFLIYILKDKKE